MMSSMVPCWLSCFWFYFQSESFDGDDFGSLAGLDGSVADGIPIFAFDEDFAGVGINWAEDRDGPAQQNFFTNAHREKLRSQTRADNKNEEKRGDDRERRRQETEASAGCGDDCGPGVEEASASEIASPPDPLSILTDGEGEKHRSAPPLRA
jgi:hypothetical protein